MRRLTNLRHECLQIRSVHDGRCALRNLFEVREVNQVGLPDVDSSFASHWVHLSWQVVHWGELLRWIARVPMRHGGYHDQTIFIRRAEDYDGVLSNCALRICRLLEILQHPSDWAHTVPMGRGWKFFGFTSSTIPEWMCSADMFVVGIDLSNIQLRWLFIWFPAPITRVRCLGFRFIDITACNICMTVVSSLLDEFSKLMQTSN